MKEARRDVAFLSSTGTLPVPLPLPRDCPVWERNSVEKKILSHLLQFLGNDLYTIIIIPYIIYIVDRHDSRDRFRVLAKPHPTTVVSNLLLPNHRITSHQEKNKKKKQKNCSSIRKKKKKKLSLARSLERHENGVGNEMGET